MVLHVASAKELSQRGICTATEGQSIHVIMATQVEGHSWQVYGRVSLIFEKRESLDILR